MENFDEILINFESFKNSLKKNDLNEAEKFFNSLKKNFLNLNTFLPSPQDSSSNLFQNVKFSEKERKEILIIRETLELGILMFLKKKDLKSFERNVLQVKSYYNINPKFLEKSAREKLILGLNLTNLLVQNRISEFHIELELIPIEEHENLFIKFAIELEMNLMEGSYKKLKRNKLKIPCPDYEIFVEIFLHSVKNELGDCAEKSYKILKIEDVKKLFDFNSVEECENFIKSRKWNYNGNFVNFEQENAENEKNSNYNAKELIFKTLNYAHEFDRVI